MTETHSIRLLIDAAGAQKGATVYKNAIGQITTATVAYQKALSSMGTKKGSADFSKMARELGQLNSIRVNPNLSRSLNELSGVLKNFKGPSSGSMKGARDFLRAIGQAQVNNSLARNVSQISSALSVFRGPSAGAAKNVQAFMSALGSARVNPQTATQLAAITSALSGFRGPSKSAAANVTQLMNSLGSSRLNPQTAGHLAQFTSALAGFRGPSAAGVRNINGLVDALNRLRSPPNVTALAAALDRIASSASNASRAARALGASHSGAAGAARNHGQATMQLTGNMRGLENAMSVSYQLGSQLRVLFGSLTFAEFTKGVYNATLATQRFNTTLGVTSKGPGEAAQQFQFATDTADKFGLSLEGVYNEYGKFTTAAKLAGQSTENVQYIFESMSGAMRVMGTDAVGQERVFRALTQIFSKGAVRAEELVQQLGEQIPGAFQMMQDALSDQLGRKVDLAKMLELGQVDDSAVVLLAKKVADTFQGQVESAMSRADASIGRLSNSWFKFQTLVGEGGVQQAIGDVAQKLSTLMESDAFKDNAVKLAKGLSDAIHLIGDGAAWAIEHVRELGVALAAFMTSSAISTIVRIGSSIASIGVAGSLAAGMFAALPIAIGAAVGAAAYYWDSIIQIGDTSISVGTIVQESFSSMGSAIYEAMVNFDLQAATSFSGVSTAGATSASGVSLAWQLAYNQMQASAENWFIQSGKGFKQILTVGKNSAVALGEYLSSAFTGKSNEDIWRDYVLNTAGDLKGIGEHYVALENGIKQKYEVEKLGIEGLIDAGKKLAEAEAKQLQEQAAAREMNNRKALDDQEKARRAALEAAKSGRPSAAEPDLSGIDPVKGGDKGDVGPQSKRMKAATKAMKDYQAELADLLVDFNAGTISLAEFNKGLDFQAKKLQETSDPYAAMVRSMQDEADVAGMATKAREVEIEYRSKINELAEKGAYLNDKQSAALRKMIEESQKLKDQPFREWVDSIEDVGVATDKIAIKAVEGLSDEIADMVVTGKADFQSLAQSILKEFIKVGLNRLYKNIFSGFGGKDKADGPASLLGPQTQEGAQGFVVKEMFKDDAMKGTFGVKGAPEVQAEQARLAAQNSLTSSFTTLKGTLDVQGVAVDKNNVAITTLTTNVDNMTTGAISAADALNRLAGAVPGGTGTGAANAYNQPFPAMPGASGEMSKALPVTFKGADQKQLAASLSSRLQADFGLTDFQAAGAVGNLAHETQGFTKLQETNPTSGRGGYGLAQWTGPRRTQFENFAKDQGKSMDDPETNYQFLKHELMTSEKNSIAALKKTTSLSEATRSFDTTFERSGVKNFASRDRYAEMALGAKSGTTPGGMQALIPGGLRNASGPQNAITAGGQYPRIGGLQEQMGQMQQVKGLALHHTGGRGNPSDVINTLNKRNFGVQYIMDRDGNIVQTGADASIQEHIKNAQNGSGLNNSNTLGMEVIAKNDADVTPAQKAAGVKWIEDMKAKYPGIGENVYGHGELNGHKQQTEGMGIVNAYRNQGLGTDQINTSGIDQATEKLKVLGTTAQQTAQQAGQQVSASQQLVTAQQQASQGTQQAAQQFTMAGVQVGQSGVAATGAAPQFTQAGTAIQQAGQQAGQGAQAAGAGLGQLAGLAGSIPGAGPYVGMFQQVLGLFGMKEGGISDSPSGFQKMPHYKEGTANTGTNGQGGIPSVLHPNEAVIPLTRGRKVGVDLGDGNNGGANVLDKGSQRMAPTFNVSIVTPDPGAFHKSKRQIETTMASAYQKSLQQDA